MSSGEQLSSVEEFADGSKGRKTFRTATGAPPTINLEAGEMIVQFEYDVAAETGSGSWTGLRPSIETVSALDPFSWVKI